jgi:hypothetical protein
VLFSCLFRLGLRCRSCTAASGFGKAAKACVVEHSYVSRLQCSMFSSSSFRQKGWMNVVAQTATYRRCIHLPPSLSVVISPGNSRTVYLNDGRLSRRPGLQNEERAPPNKYEHERKNSLTQPQRVTHNRSGSNSGDPRKQARGLRGKTATVTIFYRLNSPTQSKKMTQP